MKGIIIFYLLVQTFFCDAQSVNLSFPTTDYDSLNYQIVNIQLDTIAEEFLLTSQRNNRFSGYVVLDEYRGKFADIDTIQVVSDKDNIVCGIKIISDQKNIDETGVWIDGNYFDKPKKTDRVYIRYWKYTENIEKITEVVNEMLRHIKPLKNYKTSKVRLVEHSAFLSNGNNSVFLNGKSAKSDETERYIRNYFIDCVPSEVLESLNVVSIVFEFDDKGIASVNHISLKRTLLSIDYKLNQILTKCLDDIEGWTINKKGYWSKKDVTYLFSIKSENLDSVAMELFKLEKLESQEKERKIAARTPAQKDSIRREMEEMFRLAMKKTDKVDENEIHKVVEEMPKLIDKKYFDKLTQKLIDKFPKRLFKVKFEFIVTKDSKVENFRISQNYQGPRSKSGNVYSYPVGDKVENEKFENYFIKVFSENLPKYKVGKNRGRPVSVQVYEQVIKTE